MHASHQKELASPPREIQISNTPYPSLGGVGTGRSMSADDKIRLRENFSQTEFGMKDTEFAQKKMTVTLLECTFRGISWFFVFFVAFLMAFDRETSIAN